MGRIRVAIAGVGNCASLLVQAVEAVKRGYDIPVGTASAMESMAGYRVEDIEFVAAFDTSREKAGRDLAEAIMAYPNITPKIADIGKLGVEVKPAPPMDGVAPHMVDRFRPVDKGLSLDEVVDELRSSKADVLINLLPVGSEEATRFYAQAALNAKTAFVNGIPVFIASDPHGEWPRKFEKAGVPVLGDDVKGQLGATILHRTLVRLMHMRGVRVEETYQLNIGGNTDFENMLMEERLASKRVSKTRAVTSILPYGRRLEEEGKVRIGPSDYVPFLGNTKIAYIYVKGLSFGGLPVTIEAKLTVDDKSMCAGVLADAIRVAKIALDRKVSGPVPSASAALFKHPPIQASSDEEAMEWLREFVEGKRKY